MVLLAAGGLSWWGAKAEPFRGLPAFPAADYAENGIMLRGNTYRLKGTVLNVLAWSQKAGRLISVEAEGERRPVALVLPVELEGLNVEKGQKFFFEVTVREGGVLVVQEWRKA